MPASSAMLCLSKETGWEEGMVGECLEGKSSVFFQVCISMSAYIEIRKHHLIVEILNFFGYIFVSIFVKKAQQEIICVFLLLEGNGLI